MATKNISPLPPKYVTAGRPQYIPAGKYKKAKTAFFGEFVVKGTQEAYEGYYIETYKKQYFAGEVPEQNGVELKQVEGTSGFPKLSAAFEAGVGLLSLLQSAYNKKVSQDEANKGIAKRYFVQDNRDKKISETSKELFDQGKKELPDFIFAEVAWHITNPADDLLINGIKFQGSESRNKETIQKLEVQMPGISEFVTDYKYLVTPPAPTIPNQIQVETQIIKDTTSGQEDFRKARFDKRSDIVFPSASIFAKPTTTVSVPVIITDGLTLNLDAGNMASYPGAGTIWTDLSGNGNNGTLINGPTFDSANGGSLVFDGVNDQVTLAGAAVPSTCTVNLWIYPIPTSDFYGTILSQGAFVGIWYRGASQKVTYFYGGDYETAQTLTENQWNNVVIVNNGGNLSFYINNILDANTYTGILPFTANSIGDDAITETFKGKISNVQIYNRVLTPAEISYNYNTIKARY